MGWFDQQIEYRKKRERELLADSYDNISKSITGRKVSNAITEGADVNDAIAQLLNYLRITDSPGGVIINFATACVEKPSNECRAWISCFLPPASCTGR